MVYDPSSTVTLWKIRNNESTGIAQDPSLLALSCNYPGGKKKKKKRRQADKTPRSVGQSVPPRSFPQLQVASSRETLPNHGKTGGNAPGP